MVKIPFGKFSWKASLTHLYINVLKIYYFVQVLEGPSGTPEGGLHVLGFVGVTVAMARGTCV